MKSTTICSILLGALAATVVAQDASVKLETVSISPLIAADGSAVVDPFPVPIDSTELAKRVVVNESFASTPGLEKRTVINGVFLCLTSELNNYCRQFLDQDGVGGAAGCLGTICSVSCGVPGFTRTNNVNDICVNYNTDTQNCGSDNKVCPSVTNGTPTCNNGRCSANCANGFNFNGNQCISINNDVNNCGLNGRACPTLANGTPLCNSGTCSIACASGFSLIGGQCLNANTDLANCGGLGIVCPTPANGARTCQAGTCGIACNSGFTASGSTCINTDNDTSNCGTVGTRCAATGTGVSGATCVAGRCQVTCNNGFFQSNDRSSCSSVCADGSRLVGLTCLRYQCSTNAQCQSSTGRADSACFLNQCYSTSTSPIGLPEGSPCGLLPISGGDDAQCAAGLICVYYKCSNANNPEFCGTSRTVCPTPSNGVATCSVGTCGFTCRTGYMVNTAGTGCVLSASGRSIKKRRVQAGPELCPKGESACPIVGSASFGAFVNSSDRAKDFADSLGGYECIDTASDLESCGGCASLGTGFDCTRITHSSEVGCSNGRCVLHSCKKGYVPTLDGEKCVKAEKSQKQRSAHLHERAVRRKGISH